MNPMPTLQDLAKVAALRSEVTLQPHQQKVVDRINSGDKRLLLYHGLGSGKSLSSLAAAEAAGDDYDVVVPAALRPNYQKEVAKFTEGSNPEVLSYTGIGAGKAFQTPPKTIIFDEAHRLRNPGTASTQAATELANQAENLLLLTGTPITNSPKDLAPLLSMLRKEKITPEQFEQNYIGHRKVYPTWLSRLTGRGVGEEAYVKNEANLREQLKGLIDYQPSKTPEGVNVNEETVRVPLSRGQARIQKAVRDKIPPEYAWKLDKEYPLTRDELSRMNSFLTGLRQSSLSTQPFRGDRDPLNAFDESSKLQKAFGDLQETLKTDPRKKALIYSNYIDAGLGPYAAALQRAKIPYGMYHGSMPVAERKKALQGYNEGTLKALLLGPAAAEGISTQGTSLIQLLDPHWHESRGRQAEGRGLRFDSHEGLPPELKNVAIKRYLSESQDPSFIMSLLGARRQRTGDEILERLAANKEQLNNQFRKILQEEGSSMNKQSSIPDFAKVQELAKQASMATGLFSMAKKIVPKAISSVMPKNGWRGAVKSLAGQSAEAAYRPFKDPLKAFWQPHIAGRALPVGLASAAYGTVSAANSARNQLKAGLLPTPVAKFVGPERTNEFNAQLPSSLYSLVKANVTTQPNPADRAALQGTVNYGWDKLKSGIRSQLTYAAPSIPTGKPLAVAGVQRLASQFIPPRTTTPKNLAQHIQDQWAAKNISMKDRQDSEASRQAENLSRILYARRPTVGN